MLPIEDGEIFPSAISSSMDTEDEKPLLDLAVDKDLSTVVFPGATSTDNDIWIRFDFHKTSFVEKVVIYLNFFTDFYYPDGSCMADEETYRNCKESQKGLEVSVLKKEEHKSCGTIAVSLGLERSDQIYTFDCRAKGDAVVLTKTPIDMGTILPLWEIVIFGKYVPGWYLLFLFVLFRVL